MTATVRTEMHPAAHAVLRLLAEGLKDDAIAHRLGISVRTVRRHIADYLDATGSGSRFAAGVAACRAGLV